MIAIVFSRQTLTWQRRVSNAWNPSLSASRLIWTWSSRLYIYSCCKLKSLICNYEHSLLINWSFILLWKLLIHSNTTNFLTKQNWKHCTLENVYQRLENELSHFKIMRPTLIQLVDYRTLTLNSIQKLAYLAQLFPNVFTER